MSGLYYHAFEDKRILEDSNVADNSGNSTVCSDLAGSNDAEVLRNTMRLYGGIFLLIFVAFCFLRRRFPRVYNLRNWVEGITTDLASDTRGGMAWAWKLFAITDFEMMDECGMDALCYTRVLEFGMKLSIVGILNALWLIPVYATAKPDEVTTCVTDWVGKISVSHLAAGSYRFCATVVGAYVVFGYAMYTILQEFQWFSRYRHKFLAKTLPRNYCVYVQCIPQEYRSDQKLFDFFQQTSSLGSVLEARLAIKTPNLQKKVAERNVLVAKLEHAINLEEIQGVTLMQRRGGVIGTSLPLINVLLRQLEELNQIIAESIDRMQRVSHGLPPIPEGYTDMTSIHTLTLDHPSTVTGHENYGTTEDQVSCSAHTVENNTIGPSTTESVITSETEERPTTVNTATNLLFSNAATTSLKNSFHSAANAAGTVANAAATLLNSQDGEPLSAGFVTFKSLRAAQAAKQMIQYSEPFAMEVLEAPHPEDVYWKNVGKTHHELQIGKLISFALTAALCLLWTIPMGFISTLSSIQGLRGEFEFVDDLLTKFPGLEPFFAQLAPLLIVVANEVLKMILEMLSGLEGPISGAVVQAKLFTKLSSFMIIQTFFVTAIGGSIIAELSAMLQEPGLIIDLLAKTLPAQSTFYIQILLVDTFLSMGIELLRVSALVQAGIRSCIGPRLTEKEQQTTWMGIRPLSDPSEFEHANLLAGTVLYFTVYFVYATLAPITTIFMFICFALMATGYRHQFIYIYPTFPDSGGKLWVAFLRMVPVCMVIAQVTIVGMLALNKTAIASAMMIPLLIITILFTVYIHQKHYTFTEHLPAKFAVATDLRMNAEREMNFDFIKDKYIQPELREREVFPTNLAGERETEQGCVQLVTPPASEP